MNALAAKLAPTAVVLAAGVYVAWPYVGPGGGLPAPPAAAADAAELAESLLRPVLAPPSTRDPFEDPEETQSQVRDAIRKRLTDLVKRLEQARKAPRGPGAGPQGRGAADPLAGLVLNATYTREGRGAAVINGKVYRTGENVRPGSTLDACVLTSVGLQSVVLKYHGQDHVLKYGLAAPGSRASARAPAPPAAAKRARPRAEPAARK